MPPRTTLNAANLESLGAQRLAELLMEISRGDAVAQRRLRMELAGAASPGELSKEIGKRLASIARSRSFIDWCGVRAMADDLETQRHTITGKVAASDPGQALELLWRFMALATSIFERSDDGSGTIIGIFREACGNMGELALRAKADPIVLADRVSEALTVNDYGQYDGLVAVAAQALGPSGLEHLKRERFGQSAERSARIEQLELSLEDLEETAAAVEATTEARAGETHSRRKPTRRPLPEHLPRVRVTEPAPTACPCCGGKLHKLGEDVTETLERIPRTTR